MFVRDVPPAVDLAVAKSCADPHINFPSVHLPSAEVTEIVRERDVVTRCDGQLANFTFNRALPRRDSFLGSFSRRIQSFALQGIYDVESQHVRCVARHKPVDVLGAKCACPIID